MDELLESDELEFGEGDFEFDERDEIDEDFESDEIDEGDELDEMGEDSEFLGSIFGNIGRIARRFAPVLKRVMPAISGVFGGPLGGMLGGLFGEGDEDEFEEDIEDEPLPGLSPSNEAMAEQYAAEASVVPSEIEAAALAGAAAAKILSGAPKKVKKKSSLIVKRAARLVRALRKTRSRKARALTRILPTIVKKTAVTLARKPASKISKRTVVRTMAKKTAAIVASPKKTAVALVKNKVKRKKLSRGAIARAEK